MLIAFKSISVVDKLKNDLSFEFEMKDQGEAKKVLRMEIEQDRKGGNVSLMQKGYLKKVFQKININGDSKCVSTPLAPYFKLKATMSPTSVEESEYMTHIPYAGPVDSLIYTMICIRHDLSQVVSMADTCTIPTGVTGRSEVDYVGPKTHPSSFDDD